MSGMFYFLLCILVLSCVSLPIAPDLLLSLFLHLPLPPSYLPVLSDSREKTSFPFLRTCLVWVPCYFRDITKFDSLISFQMKSSKIHTHEYTFHFRRILSI